MSTHEIILRVDATYDLTVKVGDRINRGDTLSQNPERGAPSTAPATGVVRSIRFDPERHEFVIVIEALTRRP
jgi:Na+-translocating ferredoxin:NAD+ oxidoreductase RnfC subunit